MADSIRIDLALWPSGVVKSIQATGHAGNAVKGNNIPCAAVSVLLRTVCETINSYEGVVSRGSAPEPGLLSFELVRYSDNYKEKLIGITDFLTIGLSGIVREYPGVIDFKFESIRRN